MDPVKIAAVDIGSNSVHLVVSRLHPAGIRETLDREREMLRLGDVVFRKGVIPEDRLGKTLEVLKRFRAVAQKHDVETVLAVATSAVRDARNREEFVDRVEKEARLAVRVLSGEEEGRLIYAGVRDGLPSGLGRIAVLDLGGGSAELIAGEGLRPERVRSLPLGVLRLTAAFGSRGESSFRAMEKEVRGILGPAAREIRKKGVEAAFGTSGTILCLARLLGIRQDLAPLRLRSLRELSRRLRESSPRELRTLEAVGPSRADTIAAGSLVVRVFMEEAGLQELVPCDRALREGVVADYARRNLPRLERLDPDAREPRRRSVTFLARRTGALDLHARQVARLSLLLFDALAEPCGLDPADRERLEFAALLHDAGYWIGAERHHKHAAYLIQEGPLEGFSRDEVRVLAQVARYHRGSRPRKSHPEFARLQRGDRNTVRRLAALLRVADGLDRSHAGLVKAMDVQVSKRKVVLRLTGEGSLELELHQAERRADLFREVFARDLRFESVREVE
jgi:exopolyphosphatase/guanosine-5'-triphosphate,3'-diphosphate pyrophosphatase